MARPENVIDALTLSGDGMTIGRYEDFVLRPAYQAIYAPASKSLLHLTGFEGLIRVHQNGLPVPPPDFFAMVPPEDRLFAECMCQALHIMNYRRIEPPGKQLFINVDVSVYGSLEVLEREFYFMFSQISKYGLTRERLVFEIVETEVLTHDILMRVCELFRSNGFRFALDDFGTRHSNIERFLQVNPDIVKLDRALFNGFDKTDETIKLMRSLVNAFREAGTTVLIEGVERFDEVVSASCIGVDLMQGYGLALPQLAPLIFNSTVLAEPMVDEMSDEFAAVQKFSATA